MGFVPEDGPDRRPNLLVVVLDCVRSKSLTLFGTGRARCPALEGLASEGWATPRAISPSNWTLPSHLALGAGEYPTDAGKPPAGPGPRTLAERLAPRGYDSILFSEQAILLDPDGFARGYRIGHAPPESTPASVRLGASREGVALRWILSGRFGPAAQWLGAVPEALLPVSLVKARVQRIHKARVCDDSIVDDFAHWLTARDRSRPFHAFVNLVDAHEPYDPPTSRGWGGIGEFARARAPICFQQALDSLRAGMPWEILEAAYARAIESADRKLGRLLGALESTGQARHTAVLVTADHGQQFGEMGMVNHGSGATNAVSQVPLVTNLSPEVLDLPAGWISLTDLPRWIDRLAGGRSPVRERPGGEGERAPRCLAAPASDLNPALRGVGGPADRWNHRLQATFLDEGKLLVDATSSEILWWPRSRDPDTEPPAVLRLRADELLALRAATAPPGSSSGPAANVEPDEDASVLARLTEWGYT